MKQLCAPILLVLVACAQPQTADKDPWDDHQRHLRAAEAVSQALNGPNGPDYAAAVTAVERSGLTDQERKLQIGDLILGACRAGTAYCAEPHAAQAGIASLATAARAGGEEGTVAAGHLAIWLGRGSGAALPAEPARARCWQDVADGKKTVASCR